MNRYLVLVDSNTGNVLAVKQPVEMKGEQNE